MCCLPAWVYHPVRKWKLFFRPYTPRRCEICAQSLIMPKSAIINLSREGLLQATPFKKLSLLFGHLHVDYMTLWMTKWEIEHKKISQQEKKSLLSDIDWMIEKGILQTFLIPKEELSACHLDRNLIEDMHEVYKTIESHVIPTSDVDRQESAGGSFRFAGVLPATNDMIFGMEDIRLRMESSFLGTKDPLNQYIPLVNSFDTYAAKTSKEIATHFVLSQIPTPAESISWEQLLEFRSDAEVKRKYYALISWINDMAAADMPVSHLADKYNQLYSEYLRQYHLHKLTSDQMACM
jgi:hypothetical protein